MAQGTTARACTDCSADISDRHYNAKKCLPCVGRESSYEVVTRTCPPCGGTFTSGNKKRRYCGSACRQWDEHHPGVPRPALPATDLPRTCGWCGAHIGHLGPRAAYCCRQHKTNAASARHRERNPGYFKRYHGSPTRLAWIAANIDRIRTEARKDARARRAADPEGMKAAAQVWRDANREWRVLYEENRRARKFTNPDSVGVSERDWLRLVRRYRSCCAYCGKRVERPHMDHIIPLTRNGRHAIGNVIPACKPCNSSKNARLLADWRYRP